MPVADTPEGHLRNAIQACILGEERLATLMIPPDPQVTDLLRTVEARDGHVIALTRRVDAKKGPVVEFGKVGRNLATTFAGLCAEHDAEIFAPLDRTVFDPRDPELAFLAGYRATIREFHTSCAAGVKVQSGYHALVEAGHEPRDTMTPAGAVATDFLIAAYEMYLYKAAWDKAYAERNFKHVQHDIIELTLTQPTIAASSVFTVRGARRADGEMIRACLTVLPLSTDRTVVLFSYLPLDAVPARAVLRRALDARADHQKYELSRRIINSCENFVIGPSYFDSWTERKKNIVREYFTRTVFVEDLEYEDADLLLFK